MSGIFLYKTPESYIKEFELFIQQAVPLPAKGVSIWSEEQKSWVTSYHDEIRAELIIGVTKLFQTKIQKILERVKDNLYTDHKKPSQIDFDIPKQLEDLFKKTILQYLVSPSKSYGSKEQGFSITEFILNDVYKDVELFKDKKFRFPDSYYSIKFLASWKLEDGKTLEGQLTKALKSAKRIEAFLKPPSLVPLDKVKMPPKKYIDPRLQKDWEEALQHKKTDSYWMIHYEGEHILSIDPYLLKTNEYFKAAAQFGNQSSAIKFSKENYSKEVVMTAFRWLVLRNVERENHTTEELLELHRICSKYFIDDLGQWVSAHLAKKFDEGEYFQLSDRDSVYSLQVWLDTVKRYPAIGLRYMQQQSNLKQFIRTAIPARDWHFWYTEGLKHENTKKSLAPVFMKVFMRHGSYKKHYLLSRIKDEDKKLFTEGVSDVKACYSLLETLIYREKPDGDASWAPSLQKWAEKGGDLTLTMKDTKFIQALEKWLGCKVATKKNGIVQVLEPEHSPFLQLLKGEQWPIFWKVSEILKKKGSTQTNSKS